jgi:hypothetical protein
MWPRRRAATERLFSKEASGFCVLDSLFGPAKPAEIIFPINREIAATISWTVGKRSQPVASVKREITKPKKAVIRWLLDSDPSIRWQVRRHLTGEPKKLSPPTVVPKVAEDLGPGARIGFSPEKGVRRAAQHRLDRVSRDGLTARDPHREGGTDGFPAGAGGPPGAGTEGELYLREYHRPLAAMACHERTAEGEGRILRGRGRRAPRGIHSSILFRGGEPSGGLAGDLRDPDRPPLP